MAIGAAEIISGFELIGGRPNAPKLTQTLSVCGACGAVILSGVAPGVGIWENQHNGNQHGGALTIRAARGPYEANSP
jgi:hypothetical protein